MVEEQMIPLTPEMFQREKVRVDTEVLEQLQSCDDVWKFTTRLLREAVSHLDLAGTVLSLGDGQLVAFDRERAIVVGNLVRLRKLVRLYLSLIESGEVYGARVFERSINETLVSMLFLVRMNSREEFGKYLKGGLGNLRSVLDIAENEAKTGHGLTPLVQANVDYVFRDSGFKPEDVSKSDDDRWRVGVKYRLKTVAEAVYGRVLPPHELQSEYLTMFAGPSSTVHGDWVDLAYHHLRPVDGGFLPNLEEPQPTPDSLLCMMQYLTVCLLTFVEIVLPQTGDSGWVLAALKDFGRRRKVFDEYLATPRMLRLLGADV